MKKIFAITLYLIPFYLFAQPTKLAQKPDLLILKNKYLELDRTASAELKQKIAQLKIKATQKDIGFKNIGVTSVSHIPIEQLAGLKIPINYQQIFNTYKANGGSTTPLIARRGPARATAYDTAYDARDYNLVTNIRNQGDCSSCWSFGTMAAFETNYLLKNGGDPKLLDLSEQLVFSCSFLGTGLDRCKSGNATNYPLDYIMGHYLQPENQFAYNSNTPSCIENLPVTKYKGKQYQWILDGIDILGIPSVLTIKKAICQYGSVVSAMVANDSESSFQNFRGTEVVRNAGNFNLLSDHVIQIIGWSDARNAWLVKNSWGEGWGDGGYCWIDYGARHIGMFTFGVEAEFTSNDVQPISINESQMLQRLNPADMFKLENLANSKVVEVEDAVFSKGQKVQQYDSYDRNGLADGHGQKWAVISSGKKDGQLVYQIMNAGFGKMLTAGTKVTVEDATGLENQLWYIWASTNGDIFYIKSVATQKFLQFKGADNNNGTELELAYGNFSVQQQFRFKELTGINQPPTSVYSGNVSLHPSNATSKALDIKAGDANNGTTVQTWDAMSNNNNQKFNFVKANGADGFFIIKHNIGTNKCVEVAGFSKEENASIISWDNLNGTNQNWQIVPVLREEGKYIIFNRNSGKCLTASAGSTANGIRTGQFSYKNNNNQKWILQKQ